MKEEHQTTTKHTLVSRDLKSCHFFFFQSSALSPKLNPCTLSRAYFH
ncbi:hypothetical protein DsansV1_C03g0025681 [Dioscorea sansibarensis]